MNAFASMNLTQGAINLGNLSFSNAQGALLANPQLDMGTGRFSGLQQGISVTLSESDLALFSSYIQARQGGLLHLTAPSIMAPPPPTFLAGVPIPMFSGKPVDAEVIQQHQDKHAELVVAQPSPPSSLHDSHPHNAYNHTTSTPTKLQGQVQAIATNTPVHPEALPKPRLYLQARCGSNDPLNTILETKSIHPEQHQHSPRKASKKTILPGSAHNPHLPAAEQVEAGSLQLTSNPLKSSPQGPVDSLKRAWSYHSRSSSAEFSAICTATMLNNNSNSHNSNSAHDVNIPTVAGYPYNGVVLSAVPVSEPDAIEITTPATDGTTTGDLTVVGIAPALSYIPEGMIPVSALGISTSARPDSFLDDIPGVKPQPASTTTTRRRLSPTSGTGSAVVQCGTIKSSTVDPTLYCKQPSTAACTKLSGRLQSIDLADIFRSICEEDGEDEDWSFLDDFTNFEEEQQTVAQNHHSQEQQESQDDDHAMPDVFSGRPLSKEQAAVLCADTHSMHSIPPAVTILRETAVQDASEDSLCHRFKRATTTAAVTTTTAGVPESTPKAAQTQPEVDRRQDVVEPTTPDKSVPRGRPRAGAGSRYHQRQKNQQQQHHQQQQRSKLSTGSTATPGASRFKVKVKTGAINKPRSPTKRKVVDSFVATANGGGDNNAACGGYVPKLKIRRLHQGGKNAPLVTFHIPNLENPTASPAEMKCQLAFSKSLTTTDTSRGLGRIILPRAAAEQYLPPVPHKDGIRLEVQDTSGRWHALVLKYWHNGRPIPKKMYLLDNCKPMIEGMGLKEGDVLELYLSEKGHYVINATRY